MAENGRLIGIAARKQSGKDTAASELIRNHGFTSYSFANPLKYGVMQMFDMSEEQVFGHKKEVVDERWGTTPRKILKVIGTNLFQYDIHNYMDEGEFDVGRQIWVHRFKIWHERNKDKNVIIPDVRFPHEERAIREMGGEIWKIERPSLDNDDEHPSEKEVDDIIYDRLILNNSDLDDFVNKINSLCQELAL